MLNSIIRFSIRNKLVVGLLTLGLIIWGAISFTRLPIDAVPDITNNQVQVITVSPSLAAPEVERLVTFPVEQAMANIPGIIENRSFSRFGLSLVTIVFDDKTDVYWARQQVSERLIKLRSEIPRDAGNPEMGPVTTGLGEIYQYVLRPKKGYEARYTPMELRTMQDWIVRRQLLGTKGVADVSSFGGYLKQYEVAVNPERLKSMNVSMEELFAALQQNNQNTGGAYIEKGPNVLYIRSEGLAQAVEDIGKIFVKHTTSGLPVYVRDVATPRIGYAVRYGALCYNDEGEVAGAVVMMLKGGNSSEVISAVKEKIKAIAKTLPEGVVIEPFLDRTKMVDHAIGTVKQNLLEGALIVVFVLVLFLGNLRAGLIVASVIPLSMLFAVIMMNAFGVSGNLMSLGALDFGLIVDGAVIIVEAVMHRLYHSRHFAATNSISQHQMNDAVEQASGKMMNSAVFGQAIILVVYLPVLTLVGIEGKMFRPMAQTVSFALIGAFLLSLTYVPMMSSLALGKSLKHADNWSDKAMRFLQGIYLPALKRAMTFPGTVVAAAVIAFVFALVLITRMGGEFIPKLEEGDFAVDTRLLTGSSLSTTIETTQKAAGILLNRFPEVQKVVTKIGSGEIPTDPMPVEASDLIVILKDKKEWTSAKSFDELANEMSKALNDLPGINAGFQFPVQMRFNELMTGARQDVVCKIFGEDLDSLAAYAKSLGEIVNTVPGAKDLYVETVTGLPQIVIRYNRDAIARYKLNIAGVNRVIRAAFAGESAGMIYENERRFDLVVRLEARERSDLQDVQNLLISTPSGMQVPLGNLADIAIREGPNQIQREDAKRRIVVGFNVRGRDVQSLVEDLHNRIAQRLKLPPGYYITYGGQFENLAQAKQRLFIAVPLALLLILVMLYFAFGKLKYGLLIFSAIPLSAIGGVLALWLRGMPFSISAGIGFIALFGVAVLNGIVLIAEFNRLKAEGILDTEYIIMEAAKTRLRPVLMTASVASLGFLPMALSHGAGAEVQRPLATVVIGGLATATLLTLVVLPVLYAWVEKPKTRKRKRAIAVPLVLLAVILPQMQLWAQAPKGRLVTLEQALRQADAQNLSLRAARTTNEYWKQLQTANAEIPKTVLGGEYGNISSLNNDTRFYINQPLALPVVYKRQKVFYEASQLASEAQTGIKQAALRREVKLAFYGLVDLLERRKLLLQLDSVYSRFQSAANLRWKTGETGLLEKTSAETQYQQLQLQQDAIAADITVWQQRLQYLLNTGDWLLPVYDNPLKPKNGTGGVDAVVNHPELQYEQQQQKIAQAQTAIEKARLTPDLSVGYSNQSLVGYQTRDGINQKHYSGGSRFGFYQVSVAVPIFNGATRSRIDAGRMNETIAGINYEARKQQLDSRLRQLVTQYNQQERQLRYYEQSGLRQSALLIQNALLGFEKGDIGYTEWTQLVTNAVTIKLGYLQSIKLLNENQVELEYLTDK